MTAVGWLALGIAVLVAGAPAVLPVRAVALVASARLAPDSGERAARRVVPWGRMGPPVCVVTVVASGIVLGPALAIASSLVAGVAALLVRDVSLRRVARGRHAELRAAVRLLVAELDAGARPADALHAAVAVAPAHAAVLDAAAQAADAGDDAGAVLVAAPATRALGVAWQVGERTGVALAAVLARVARDLDSVDEQRRAVGVALSGPVSSAAVLTGLPVVGIALGAAMGAQPLSFLLASDAGRVVFAVGIALDAVGVLWIRRIVRRAQDAR